MPPLAPKIRIDSAALRPRVSSKPRNAVIASTGIAPACWLVNLPGCASVVDFDSSVLGVATALGIHQAKSVNAIARFEFLDVITYSRDGARAIGAEHIGELRLDSE